MSSFGFSVSFSIKTIHEITEFRSGAVLDLDCPGNEQVLQKMSRRKLFSTDREWLFIEKEFNDTNTTTFLSSTSRLQKLYILPGSRATLMKYSTYRGSYSLYDTYRIALWTPIIYNFLTEGTFNKVFKLPKRKERNDFGGVTLRSASAIIMPEMFHGFWTEERKEADAYGKAIMYIAYNIGFHYNFSISLFLETSYGYEMKNGSFSGLTGLLEREEIDFSSVGSMMREDRMKVVDFTGEVFPMVSPIIFRQPSLSTVTNIFIYPFSKSVWLAGAVLSIVAAFMLYMSFKFGGMFYNIEEKKDISTSELLTTIFSCICQQGPDPIKEAPGARIILFLFELMIFFMFVAYSAKVVALLQSSSESIKTLKDLTNGPLEIGVQDFIYNKMHFEESKIPEVIEFYNRKIKPQGDKAFIENPEDGMRKVRTGLFAFKLETNWAYKIVSDTYNDKEKCGLSEVHVFLLPMLSLSVPKRSGLREHITRSVARQKEVGLMSAARKRTYTSKPTCNLKSTYARVALVDFKPAIEVISLGVLLSFFVLILEIFSTVRKNILKKLHTRTTKVKEFTLKV